MSLLNSFSRNLQTLVRFPKFVRTGASLVSLDVASTVQTAKANVVNHSPEVANSRKRLPLRTGLIGIKRGMIGYYSETGERFACTVVEIDSVEVIYNKTFEKEGYYAVQLGYGNVRPEKTTRQLLGHFEKAVVSPKQHIMEFRVKDESGLIKPGTELKADHFQPGQLVDVKSVSKGKGFAGVMKRYGFKGLRATHGTSLAHRTGGSYGANQTPGRVLPGKKMPGHMGARNATIQNSKIVEVNAEKGYILIKGPVSGPKGALVKIQDAVKQIH